MVKKIVYAGTAIAITIGAAYSYDQVRFGDRTLVFFRSVFGGGGDVFGEGGRGGGFERRDRFRADSTRRRFVEGRERNRAVRPDPEDAQARAEPPVRDREDWGRQVPEDARERPEGSSQSRAEGNVRSIGESRGREGRRGRRSDVSLEMVGYYTLILSFAVLLTHAVDGLARRVVRARRATRYSHRQQSFPAP